MYNPDYAQPEYLLILGWIHTSGWGNMGAFDKGDYRMWIYTGLFTDYIELYIAKMNNPITDSTVTSNRHRPDPVYRGKCKSKEFFEELLSNVIDERAVPQKAQW
jgi:hypothetical protein